MFQGPGRIEIQHIPTPRPVGSEILVRVLGCTLCASDLHSYYGRRVSPSPAILGHEILGQIEQFGPQAAPRDAGGQSLSIGDRVSWAVVAACGECFYCERDLPQKCLKSIKYGHHALEPGHELSGGMAEHVLLAPGTQVVRWAADVPLGVACPASCAASTCMAAIEAVGPLHERSIMIVGAGMLGLSLSAMAADRGADRVLLVDTSSSRLDKAMSFGATHALLAEQVPQWIQAEQPRGFDIVLEMSGTNSGFDRAWQSVRIGGTICLVGAVYPSPAWPLELEQVVRRCIRLIGVHNYAPRHLLQAVAFLSTACQRFPFEGLVERWYTLADAALALQDAQQSRALRIGLTTSHTRQK